MGLSSYKITSGDIAQKGVVAAPDKLTGNAQQNKMVFDRLIREVVAELFNGLIDELTSEEGAGDIGLTEIDGVTGSDVQTALGSVKTILDTKSASADTAAALALKSDKSITDLHVKSVGFNAQTGVFTFTREDGTYTTIDTALEKVATNWQYDASTQSLVLTLVDGTTQTVPLSAFITETEFTASDSVVFSVSNHVVSASVKSGSITDSMLSSALVAQLQGYVSDAASSATAAAQSASAAEGYKNAASKSASDASLSASEAAGSASDASDSESAAAGSASAAAGSASAASGSASTASQKALDSADSAEDSEAWAVGQRGGTDVPSTDVTYNNNAKYWAGQAHQAAGGGVTSFNGRAGTVTPQSGDYTAAMVGADPSGASAEVQNSLDTHTGNGDIHVTAAQKTAWNNKQNALTFDSAPASGSTNPVTSGGVYTAIQNAGKSPYVYAFAASDWSSGTITIAAATHGFTGSGVVAQFYHLVSGSYVAGTWACVESWAEIDASTHVITLHGPTTGYAGKVVLYG